MDPLRLALSASLMLGVTSFCPPCHAEGNAAPAAQAEPKAEKPSDKAGEKAAGDKPKDEGKAEKEEGGFFTPMSFESDGHVDVAGQGVDYHAVVGTIVVHPHGFDDAPQKPQGDKPGDDKTGGEGHDNPSAEAAMSYYYYAKKDAGAENRPVIFLYNGGPGSSTVWLHMGAFGPRRVVTNTDTHTPAAPYQLVNNDGSLLDVADLVFIDAPGTGFGRIAGPGKEKAFWGVDQDAHAFAEFIQSFITKYGRWNSPKYLFGESYGTTRSAVLANLLQSEKSIDLNGVILLSQILNFGLDIDSPETSPGIDRAFELALPTYAATAYYHKKLPHMPQDLRKFLDEVEHFAMTEYEQALAQGNALPEEERARVVGKLHEYTGLPEEYLRKAKLRVTGGEFEKTLQDDDGMTTGRLDARFSGPTRDPLSKAADYDPFDTAISSAFVSSFNDYVRKDLHYAGKVNFKPQANVFPAWQFTHRQPGTDFAFPGTVNVMPDLAEAMVQNPNLHVQVHGGYFDVGTPYYQAEYELKHLPMPAKLMKNIEFKGYESGHMVYLHLPSLKAIHDNVAGFVRATATPAK